MLFWALKSMCMQLLTFLLFSFMFLFIFPIFLLVLEKSVCLGSTARLLPGFSSFPEAQRWFGQLHPHSLWQLGTSSFQPIIGISYLRQLDLVVYINKFWRDSTIQKIQRWQRAVPFSATVGDMNWVYLLVFNVTSLLLNSELFHQLFSVCILSNYQIFPFLIFHLFGM